MPSYRHPVLARLGARLEAGPHRRAWRHGVRSVGAADLSLRAAVFVLGSRLVAAGVALWVFSTLLTAPVLFAGLWVLSWEFAWARRLMHAFRGWVRTQVRRARRHPVRWAAATAATLALTIGGYWALMSYGPSMS